jgi:hypothetical protein
MFLVILAIALLHESVLAFHSKHIVVYVLFDSFTEFLLLRLLCGVFNLVFLCKKAFIQAFGVGTATVQVIEGNLQNEVHELFHFFHVEVEIIHTHCTLLTATFTWQQRWPVVYQLLRHQEDFLR